MGCQDPLLRAAHAVHLQFTRPRAQNPDALGPDVEGLFDRLNVARRSWARLAKARSRGWALAAARLRGEFFLHARHVQQHLPRVLVHEDDVPPPLPSVRDLLEDLRQLGREFERVEVRAKDKVVAVTSESIELEGITLGPFSIELHLDRLPERPGVTCFDCVALEPNPAGSDDSVTHPHVRGKGLCGGDATPAIQSALRQGRICDAFCLVRSVLRQYNPSSPYVALQDWDGTRCHDCDCLTSSSELHYCDHCGHDCCDDCSSYCLVCDQACCAGCLETDEVSGRRCCPDCRHACSACGCTVDCDRFVGEHELCPECHEGRRRQQDTETQPSTPENEDEPITPAPGLAAVTAAAAG